MKNVFFLNTSSTSITYWRMFNFWKAAHRGHQFNVSMPYWMKDSNDNHKWETDLACAAYNFGAAGPVIGQCHHSMTRADVLVAQTVHWPFGLDMIRSLRETFPHIPIVTECDDDYLHVPEYNPAANHYRPGSEPLEVVKSQIAISDAMIVSTPHLKQVYSDLCEHIYVVPNCIDFDHWGKAKKGNKPGLRIGWMGGANHHDDLMKVFFPVCKELAIKFPKVKVVLFHGAPQDFASLPNVTIVKKWTPIQKYPKMIASLDFDIGVAPLVDSNFNRAKSNLRWLEYSALGIPCVASRIGHFASTLKDGEDCLLASSTQEWMAHLTRLIESKSERISLGYRAQERVKKDFNVDTVVDTYSMALDEIIARGQIRKPTDGMIRGQIEAEAVADLSRPKDTGITEGEWTALH